jgi:hypothetical protein
MNEDRSGPWDNKLKDYVEKQPIVAIIHNLDTDSIEREFQLDLGNKEDKKFLGRISFWAVTNNKSVETLSMENWWKHFK